MAAGSSAGLDVVPAPDSWNAAAGAVVFAIMSDRVPFIAVLLLAAGYTAAFLAAVMMQALSSSPPPRW
jgi:hypothetical protein